MSVCPTRSPDLDSSTDTILNTPTHHGIFPLHINTSWRDDRSRLSPSQLTTIKHIIRPALSCQQRSNHPQLKGRQSPRTPGAENQRGTANKAPPLQRIGASSAYSERHPFVRPPGLCVIHLMALGYPWGLCLQHTPGRASHWVAVHALLHVYCSSCRYLTVNGSIPLSVSSRLCVWVWPLYCVVPDAGWPRAWSADAESRQHVGERGIPNVTHGMVCVMNCLIARGGSKCVEPSHDSLQCIEKSSRGINYNYFLTRMRKSPPSSTTKKKIPDPVILHDSPSSPTSSRNTSAT